MTSDLREIAIQDYDYDLSESKIAQKPVERRTSSKLLVYRNGEISHDSFNNLGQHLPPKSCLIFNNTRVIPARMFFVRDTGASIQVFLLSPMSPHVAMELALENTTGSAHWQCLVGNAKRWRIGEMLQSQFVYEGSTHILGATMVSREPFCVKFEWPPGISFSSFMNAVGKMPLPPYIKRDVVDDDKKNYQTVYARHDGAIAAPTAGLHFSHELIRGLVDDGHKPIELTLHVGAGTFLPVETQKA